MKQKMGNKQTLKLTLLACLLLVSTTFPSISQAALTNFVADPSTSNVSADIGLAGTLHMDYSVLSGSSDFSDSQSINSSVSGTIDSEIDNDLIFWGMNLQSSPNVTLSDSITFFNIITLPISVTINSLTFDYTGPSDPFALTPTATAGQYDFGPADLPFNANANVEINIYGVSTTMDVGLPTIPLSGTVQLDGDGLPSAFYASYDGTMVIPFVLSDEALNGVSWTADGELSVSNFTLDLEGQSTAAVPLPGAIWMFGSGLAGIVALRRRKR